MNTKKKDLIHEYRNDFLYVVIKATKKKDRGEVLFCMGTNTTRFFTLTHGRHGVGSNPAVRGLQLVKKDIRTAAIARGARPTTSRGYECEDISYSKDAWYKDSLLVEDAPESFPSEMFEGCVMNLLKRVLLTLLPEINLPQELPEPAELERFIESLCEKYGR